MDDLLLDAWAEPGMVKAQRLILRGKSPPAAGAVGDAFLPGDLAPRGGEHAGLVGCLSGRPAADGTFAQLLLGPVVRLLLDIDLDELPGHLVAQRRGDGFQFRELDACGRPSG